MSDEKTVDQLNLSEIEIRSDLRMTKASNITDGEMAAADAKNLLQIVSPELAKKAAAQVSDNMQEYPGYAKLMSENHTDVIDRIKSLAPNTDMKTLLKNSIDLRAFEDLEKRRAAEFNEVREALKQLNTIERVVETTVKPDSKSKANSNATSRGNEVESDEIFTSSASTAKVATIIPANLEKRFVRVGNKYYYAANTEALAFEDKGNSLITKSNGEGMAASFVAIANARGWDEIKVSGSETFKREVWLEAAARGMHVKGYKPNEFDLAALEKRVPENKIEKVFEREFRGRENIETPGSAAKNTSDSDKGNISTSAVKNTPDSDKGNESTSTGNTRQTGVIYGELLEHGKARYQHDNKKDMSYFVKIQNEHDEVQTLWGLDLERAMKVSGSSVGDKIELERVGKKQVPVTETIYDESGAVISTQEIVADKRAWRIDIEGQKRTLAQVFELHPTKDAAISHPELAGAAALTTAVFERHSSNLNEDEKKVVLDQVKKNVVKNIANGKIPDVQVAEKNQTETRNQRNENEKDLSL